MGIGKVIGLPGGRGGGPRLRVVVSRGRCTALCAAAFLLGAAMGAAAALAWGHQRVEQSSQQARQALALAAMYLEDLVAAQDNVVGAQAPQEEKKAQDATTPARAEGAADEHVSKQAAASAPRPVHAASSPANPMRVEVVRMTREQASVATLASGAVTFRSGVTYKVGDRLPSGAMLLAVDASNGRIVTDRRIIALSDWAGMLERAQTNLPAPGEGRLPSPSMSKEVAAREPASSSAANPAVASPTSPAIPQATTPSMAPHAVQSGAVSAGGAGVEVVSAQQANIAAIQNNGVRFMSGRFVAVGEAFPSGEKLLRVLPAEGRIITDRRTIQIKEAQAHD